MTTLWRQALGTNPFHSSNLFSRGLSLRKGVFGGGLEQNDFYPKSKSWGLLVP